MATPLLQHKKICSCCGKEFITNYIKSKFCSKICAYNNGRKKLLQEKKFNPEKFIERNKKYKQEKIKKKLLQNIPVIGISKNICVVCKKEFIITQSKNQKYCSNICRKFIENERHKIFRKSHPELLRQRDKKAYNNGCIKRNRRIPGTPAKCIVCNNTFIPRRNNTKICDNEICKRVYKSIRYDNNYEKIKARINRIRKEDKRLYIKILLQSRLRSALRARKTNKDLKIETVLGCTINFLFTYLQKQFKEGMSWNNYGRKGWHIDHIKPCCSFDLTNHEEQKKCFHYTNLQPLWEIENYKKGGKYDVTTN